MAEVTLTRPNLTDEEREKRMNVTRAIAAQIWQRVMKEEQIAMQNSVQNSEL